jgi:hypothetical protein
MTATVTISLDDLEKASALLNRASSISKLCFPSFSLPLEMLSHATILQRICEERRQEIFSVNQKKD